MANKTKSGSKSKGRKPTTQQRRTIAVEQSKRQMWAVVLFAVGILFLALTIIKGSKIWLSVHNVLFGIMGWSAYFLGPFVLYIAVITARDKNPGSIKAKLWQVGALILTISGAIEIFTKLPEVEGANKLIAALYEKGVSHKGGGVLGIILAGPLTAISGSPVPQIIIILVIFVLLMLITGSSLLSLYQVIKKPVKGIENVYNTQMENRQIRLDEKASQPKPEPKAKGRGFNFFDTGEKSGKFDIDVDISGDKDPAELENLETIEPFGQETGNLPQKGFEEEIDKIIDEKTQSKFDSYYDESKEANDFPFNKIDNTPEADFGVDKPVEYINVQPFVAIPRTAMEQNTIQQQPRPHPLDEDIRLAQEDDISKVLEDYLDSIKTNDDSAVDTEDYYLEGTTLIPENNNYEAENNIIYPDFWDKEESAIKIPEIIPAPELERPKETISKTGVIPPKPLAEEVGKSPVYVFPPVELLKPYSPVSQGDVSKELRENGEKLVATLESFGVKTKILDISRGPAVTRYELQPLAGVKISRITGLADDIALNLAAAGIRIEAPIPNKAAVGVEVPNKNISMVGIRELIDSDKFKKPSGTVSTALGKDITGNITIAEIARMPHVLIAGSTGSGKSVCINSIIISILYKYSPDEVKLLMIDPKMVELGIYNGIPHLLVPVVTDAKKSAGALSWAVTEMLNRYKTFASNMVRDINGYNKLAEKSDELEHMPQIVIIIDELSDLMMAAPNEVEGSICRLAQMARAAGMHLVIATQRPSVDVITGLIKANVPSRIAFAVSSQIDSRTILDAGGAEKLLGRGDMLFYPVGAAKPTRVQGCFVSDEEVEKVVDFIKEKDEADYDQNIVEEIDRHAVMETSSTSSGDGGGFDEQDEKIPEAIECILDSGQASISLLQRRLGVGHARAGRLVDTLEQMGIVGPHEGSKPRQLLITRDQYLEMKLMNEGMKIPTQTTLPIGDETEE